MAGSRQAQITSPWIFSHMMSERRSTYNEGIHEELNEEHIAKIWLIRSREDTQNAGRSGGRHHWHSSLLSRSIQLLNLWPVHAHDKQTRKERPKNL